jgi:hypothetical protein
MSDRPNWISAEASASILNWTNFLHIEAKRVFNQDGTHANLMFSFSEEKGIVSVNLIPPNTEHDHLNEAITNAVIEHHLYGVVLIGETWMYCIKEKDHTAFQLLDGEMKVSDLNNEDKKEALMVRMESRDGDCLTYLDEIIRNEKGHSLKEGEMALSKQKKWFVDSLKR